jgi:hypothetical protein
MKDWTYLEAVEQLHELITAECMAVADSMKGLEASGSEAAGTQLDLAGEALVRLGTEKARAWTMLQEARLRAPSSRLPDTQQEEAG